MKQLSVTLPEYHAGQREVVENARRFNVLACGRRWGKTSLGERIVCEAALNGQEAGWFAPTYKFLIETYMDVMDLLQPVAPIVYSNKSERFIRLKNGGRIDFWSMERPHAGRGRKYHVVAIDEGAMVQDLMREWTMAIRPTLADYRGKAWFFSTPFGMNDFHRLWTKGTSEPDWQSWQVPTSANPYIPADEIEHARRDLPRDAFAQEFMAEFLADAANPFGIDDIRACIDSEIEPADVAAWGVDLAKSTDWTVAIGLDERGNVVAFQRWQSDWRNTIARLKGMVQETPAMIDSTGVGDPIVEEIQQVCGAAEGFKFSSGSKQQIYEGLATAIQRRQIRYPDGTIPRELETFQYQYLPSGRVRYAAADGCHDDCADALALAVHCLRAYAHPVNLDFQQPDDDRGFTWQSRRFQEANLPWLHPDNDALFEWT